MLYYLAHKEHQLEFCSPWERDGNLGCQNLNKQCNMPLKKEKVKIFIAQGHI